MTNAESSAGNGLLHRLCIVCLIIIFLTERAEELGLF